MNKPFSAKCIPSVFILAAGVFLSLLQACTLLPKAADDTPLKTQTQTTVPANGQKAVSQGDSQKTKENGLSAEQVGKQVRSLAFISPFQEYLYKTLLAELAGYQGEHGLSAKYYLDIAVYSHSVEAARRATKIALFAKEYDVARDAGELWAKLEPHDPEVRQILAAVYLHQDNNEQALKHLNILLDNPTMLDQQRLEIMVKLLVQGGGGKKAALQTLQQLSETRPHDTQLALLYAYLLFDSKQYDKAAEMTHRALQGEPENREAATLYLRILSMQQKNAEAMAWVENWLEKHPDDRQWEHSYARMLLNLSSPKALSAYKKLMEKEPDNTEYMYTLALLYIQDKQFKQARKQLNNLIKTAGSTEQVNSARYLLAQIAELENRTGKAIGLYRQIEVDTSHYFEARTRIVLLLLREGKPAESLQLLNSIEAQSAEESMKLYQLEADILVQTQEYHAAMEVYDRALEEFSDDTDLLYMRAMIAEKIDRLDILERDIRRILEIEPNNTEALNALGYTLADRTGRYDEAQELIRRAFSLKPDAHHILDSMGWVLYRQGHMDEALEYLQRALQTRYDPEIAAHLGEVLWQKGDKDGARQVWEAALKEFPDDTTLNAVIKRFASESQAF